MNQTSVWSLTVPVLPATGTPTEEAAGAVPPGAVTPRIIFTIVRATYSLTTAFAPPAAGDEHAAHLGAAADPGFLQLEADQSPTGQMVHGAHDGLMGQVAALPLGFLGVLLLKRRRKSKSERERGNVDG